MNIQSPLKNLRHPQHKPSGSAMAEPEQETLRVLTYNIHHGRGTDGHYDLSRIAAVLASESPDVVALQEIERFRSRSRRDDQPRLLAETLDMYYCFAPVRDHRKSDKHAHAAYGNAILSRFPIRSTSHFDLSVAGGREPRGCLHALIETPWGLVHVFCVHLGLRYSERREQVARLASEEIIHNPRLTPAPAIVLGDFNNWWPVRTSKKLQEAFRNTCLVTGRKRLRTFGHPMTFLALDYIYVSPEIEVMRCYVSRKSLARVASDHRPLVSDLRLPRCK
ncbi:MAG: endonuclease/exonuclease/phosphatase family protein [Candidatus Sumerlaeaceae bacterium]|jgi:endonuclease/exonuclease/phosphatase family metal-dependent hydrolase